MTNCPNCGAPFDSTEIKCLYCGTLFYDLSTIPIGKPFCLTINAGTESKPNIITGKAICQSGSFEMNYNMFSTVELGFIFLEIKNKQPKPLVNCR